MKKVLSTILIAILVMAIFSFTNNRPVLANEDEYSDDIPALLDTVPHPHKKDTTKKKSGTTPYDSFGKPKKMDTTKS